ncbi:unnamed protein product [Caretta caretta]
MEKVEGGELRSFSKIEREGDWSTLNGYTAWQVVLMMETQKLIGILDIQVINPSLPLTDAEKYWLLRALLAAKQLVPQHTENHLHLQEKIINMKGLIDTVQWKGGSDLI